MRTRISKLMAVVICMGMMAFSASATAGQISGWGYITELYVPSDGGIVRIIFSEPIVNPGNCGGTGFYIKELDSSAGSSRFLSIITAAFVAHKQVEFWVSGCTTNQYWGATRPQILGIHIQP